MIEEIDVTETEEVKKAPVAVLLLMLLLIVCIIFSISWIIANRYNVGAFVDWESLGPLPDSGSEFIYAEFDPDNSTNASVFVEAENGVIYRGSLLFCTTVEEKCWHEVEAVPEHIPLRPFVMADGCLSEVNQIGSPPSQVKSCLSFADEAAGSHMLQYAHFALLEDGTVWVWQFVPGMGAAMILFIGGLLAVLVAIFIAQLMYRRRKMS